MFARTAALAAPLAALLLLGGCAYDYPGGYAPQYPAGYDAGMGSGQYAQPGDQFGAQDVASVEVFYETLAPYGRWIDSRFGYAFQPQTNEGWRPYVNGRWGENRLWISDDPWGWATDHYGRWGYDEQVGWVWVPGTQWAPSWVAFREADQVTGWAPIPPGVSYSVGVGFGSGFGFNNFNSWYQPSWVWVPTTYLYRPRFGGNVLPWNNGVNYWRGSRWNYNYGRPNYGRPVYNRPGTARPPVVRPGNGRPDGWNGNRPGNGRPDGWNGNRPNRPDYVRPAGTPGRPDGTQWQGRPNGAQGQTRPDGTQWQGRPNRGQGGMVPAGQGRQGRAPAPVVAAATPGAVPQVNAPVAVPQRTAPVRVERAAQPARKERAEPQRTERAQAQRFDRGSSQRGNAQRYERPR